MRLVLIGLVVFLLVGCQLGTSETSFPEDDHGIEIDISDVEEIDKVATDVEYEESLRDYHADRELGNIPGAAIILRQENGMDQVQSLLFDILFSENRILQFTDQLTSLEFTDIPLSKSLTLNVKRIKLLKFDRPKGEGIKMTLRGIQLSISELNFDFEVSIRVFKKMLGKYRGANAQIHGQIRDMSFSALLIPELKTNRTKSRDSKRLAVNVKQAEVDFEKVDLRFSRNSGSYALNFIYKRLQAWFSSWLRDVISTEIEGAIKEHLPVILSNLLYSQTEAIISVIDSALHSYGVELDLAKNFDYNNSEIQLGDGYFEARADLVLDSAPEIDFPPTLFQEWFRGPAPRHWMAGSDGQRVVLQGDPPYEPHTPGREKIKSALKCIRDAILRPLKC